VDYNKKKLTGGSMEPEFEGTVIRKNFVYKSHRMSNYF
jgi:hypothetical protein